MMDLKARSEIERELIEWFEAHGVRVIWHQGEPLIIAAELVEYDDGGEGPPIDPAAGVGVFELVQLGDLAERLGERFGEWGGNQGSILPDAKT